MSDRFVMVKLGNLDLLPFQSRLNIEGLEFEALVKSVRENGVLEPLLVRQKGERFEVMAGGRRMRAAQCAGLSEVPCVVEVADDERAMDIHFIENLHRADLTAEEKRVSLGNYARIRKLDAKQIAEKLHMSDSWVLLYLPSEFKDKVKAEAGKLGGEARAATSLVAHTVKTQDMQTCEVHGTASSDTAPVPIYGKPRILCGRCRHEIEIGNTEKIYGHFHNLNGESKAAEHEPAPKPLYTEKWEHKLGTMQTNDPEAERFHDEEAQKLGLFGFRVHPEIPVIVVKPDRQHVATDTFFWYDNEELHQGERADKDEYYRKILEKRGFKNEVHTFKGKTTRARVREFLVAWMKKAGLDKVEAS